MAKPIAFASSIATTHHFIAKFIWLTAFPARAVTELDGGILQPSSLKLNSKQASRLHKAKDREANWLTLALLF